MHIPGPHFKKVLIQLVRDRAQKSIFRSSHICRQAWEPLCEESAEEADMRPSGHVEKHVSQEFSIHSNLFNGTDMVQDYFFCLFLLVTRKYIPILTCAKRTNLLEFFRLLM